MLERVSFDRGLHLRGTPLWFDAERKRELCVLTGLAGRLPPRHKRAVASPELAAALGRAGFDASVLPAPWDRWMGLGGQQIRLLPAGAEPGAALAMISSGRERILVAGLLRQAPVAWPHAELLVASVPTLDHRGGSFEQVMRAVRLFVDQAIADKVQTAVLVDSVEVGLAVHAALEAIGRAGRATGLLGKLIGPVEGVVGRLRLGLSGARMSPSVRAAWIDSGLGACGAGSPRAAPKATFRLRWYADWGALKRAVSMTRARKLVLIGIDASQRPAFARRLGSSVEVLALGRARQLELSA